MKFQVKGWVRNAKGEVKFVISGTWDTRIELAPVLETTGTPDNPSYKTGPYVQAWLVNPPK